MKHSEQAEQILADFKRKTGARMTKEQEGEAKYFFDLGANLQTKHGAMNNYDICLDLIQTMNIDDLELLMQDISDLVCDKADEEHQANIEANQSQRQWEEDKMPA